ncbi:YebC/PmpR family DNA-binding transcriptional regulator [Candidatus Saccharibacteria bacterium]|nr:YebC/PmpR family DNA-binding transcriptional regulator [Candidatus Saccharibacteria bacterium]
MAGHSKWATTKRQKAVVDAKRGSLFTKLGNQIAIAARGGADPAMNPSLAMAIDRARAANMPNENIKRAMARAEDKNAAALIEEVYEGIGPGGVGLIIEVATDNRNRTLPDVKNALAKNGGRLADSGSIAFQFKRQGVIEVGATGEEVLLAVLDGGAMDAVEEEGEIIAFTEAKDLMAVRQKILDGGFEVLGAELRYVPTATVEMDAETREKALKLMDALDDLDDVVNVSGNF